MAVSAIVKDGSIVETAAQTSTEASKNVKANNGYDKDAFMQLLVAQMKYQDPLEPTSNTEYISQYATFSQVEQLQNMAGTMELSRASTMVGKTVEISTTTAKGEDKLVEGIVDYVKYEGNKAYVSVNGDLYPADQVTAVIDETYNTAYNLANKLAEAINSLPRLSELTLNDLEAVSTLVEGFDNMTVYQQSFLDKSYQDLLKQYSDRMEELVMIAEKEAESKAEAEKAGETKAEESNTVKEETEANEALDEEEKVSPVEEV
ncbi:MAG: flagellar hook capping protein [Lachnospiraceae bacterium]|nr:flagellar hook capping protein [Lachnospiraceae bacterium]